MFSLAFEAAQEKSRSITSPPRWDVQLWCELPLYIFSGSAKTSAGIHLIHCLARESSVGMREENDAEACSLKFPVLIIPIPNAYFIQLWLHSRSRQRQLPDSNKEKCQAIRQNILAYELRPMLLSLTSEILRHSLGFIKLLEYLMK